MQRQQHSPSMPSERKHYENETLRPPLSISVAGSAFEDGNPKFSRGGANPSKRRAGVRAKKLQNSCCKGVLRATETREKNAEPPACAPQSAIRRLTHAVSCQRIPLKHVRKASKHSADFHPATHLEGVCSGRIRELHKRCHAFVAVRQLFHSIVSQLLDYRRTSHEQKSIRRQHLPGRSLALPTAAHAQALACDTRPNRKRGLVRFPPTRHRQSGALHPFNSPHCRYHVGGARRAADPSSTSPSVPMLFCSCDVRPVKVNPDRNVSTHSARA